MRSRVRLFHGGEGPIDVKVSASSSPRVLPSPRVIPAQAGINRGTSGWFISRCAAGIRGAGSGPDRPHAGRPARRRLAARRDARADRCGVEGGGGGVDRAGAWAGTFEFRHGPERFPLPPREAEILRLIGQEFSNKAVARRLGIAVHTVKFHIEAVFGKLDATSRAEAVAKGLMGGVIEL
jgi:DNA-binding CsgD family transcriptional regulator